MKRSYDRQFRDAVPRGHGGHAPGVRALPRGFHGQVEPAALLVGQLRSCGDALLRPDCAEASWRSARACPTGSRAKPTARKCRARASGRAGSRKPTPFFYSYAYPEPAGFRDLQSAAGGWNGDWQEFILPYEEVRTAADPGCPVGRFPPVDLRCSGRPRRLGSRQARAGAGGALAGQERERRDRLPVLVDREHPPGRRHGAIGALHPRTDGAGRSDGRCRRVREIQTVGIGDARRIADVAAETDGKQGIVAKLRAGSGARSSG